MRRIALQEYLSKIEGLLDDNRLPEAAAHCHYVLQQYPRLIAAYRLFGRALLEQQLYDEAIDVFERLLSADPEDLISHAGLALAYAESRDAERAIWHMERAFEVDPYNRAIQDELRKLYIARDGDAPPRLSLTRASLARLHLRAALYPQAAAEFSRLAKEHPERIDLQLALADTLFWDSKPAEAAALCEKVLESLPFCIKANAIRADALLRDERVDEARDHLKRVQALTMLDRTHLDPETTLGRALSNARITLPKSVPVEVLEDTLAFARGFEESGAWPEQAAAVVVDGETAPDWLQDFGRSELAAQSVRLADTERVYESDEPIDWLDEVGTSELSARSWEHEQASAELAEAVHEAGEGDAAEPKSDRETAADSFDTPRDDAEIPAAAQQAATFDGVAEMTQAARDDSDLEPGDSSKAPLEEQSPEIAGAQEGETPVWEDEPLLALDELRSYVDMDSDAAVADSAGPDWLDELTEGTDVVDELPQWLHEAVGLDATDYQEADSSSSPPPGAAPTGSGSDHEGSSFLDQDLPVAAKGDSVIEGQERAAAPEQSGSGVTEPAAKSAVPDWLLAADDVLDELPPELQHLDDEKGSVRSTEEQGDTMSWLDELSAQLMGDDDYDPISDASSDDELNDAPGDSIAQ